MLERRTVLRGGLVADGEAAETRRLDVAFAGGRIMAVSERIPAVEGDHVIDVDGKVICPGFIDVHVHAEGVLARHGCLEPALAQGVTTLVLGQDGCSWAPSDYTAYKYMQEYFSAINGRLTDPGRVDLTMSEMINLFDRKAQNVAHLVPHGNIRIMVDAANRAPLTGQLLIRAGKILEAALEAGAVGMSSGLDYVPSSFADAAEMIALGRVIHDRGAVYVSHVRKAGQNFIGAMDELVEVAKASRARVHASHLRASPAAVAEVFRKADDEGVGLTFDSYPYAASSSLLSMFVLPADLQSIDIANTVAQLNDSAVVRRLEDMPSFTTDFLAKLVFSHVGSARHRPLEGHSVLDSATMLGMGPAELVAEVLRDSRLQVTVISHAPTTSQSDIDWLARHSRHIGSSDGIYVGSHVHPRSYGAFAALLNTYLQQPDGWALAAKHLAGRAARTFGLERRGSIKAGYAADLAIFDPASIASPASYEDPKQSARGLCSAYVNGTLTWTSGSWTGSTSGRSLQR